MTELNQEGPVARRPERRNPMWSRRSCRLRPRMTEAEALDFSRESFHGARDAAAGGGLGDAFGFDERRLARALVLFGPHHGADDGAEPVSDRPATGGHTATIEEFIALRDQVEAAAAAILVSSGGVVRVKDPDAVLRSMAAFRVAGASMIGSLLLMAHRMPGFGLGDDEFIKGLAVDLGAGFACAERGRRK